MKSLHSGINWYPTHTILLLDGIMPGNTTLSFDDVESIRAHPGSPVEGNEGGR